MTAYQTVSRMAEAELIVKKSRFIGQIAPAQSPEAAMEFVASIKAKHWDASHNVWAYSLREGQLRRYSDDGEPQGTAGLPALDTLLKQELVDCVVVVTRYFGGTLLGTGGLTRAYGQAASAAIEAAGVVTMAPCQVLRVACDYGFYGALQRLIPAFAGTVLDTQFAGETTVTLRLRAEDAQAFCKQLAEKSNGRVGAVRLHEEFAQICTSTIFFLTNARK